MILRKSAVKNGEIRVFTRHYVYSFVITFVVLTHTRLEGATVAQKKKYNIKLLIYKFKNTFTMSEQIDKFLNKFTMSEQMYKF